MATDRSHLPPSIDPVAARRWAGRPHAASPWLHEEVARRMAERLGVIRLPVQAWAHWEPVRGGLAGHDLVIDAIDLMPGLDGPAVRALRAAMVEAHDRHREWIRTHGEDLPEVTDNHHMPLLCYPRESQRPGGGVTIIDAV